MINFGHIKLAENSPIRFSLGWQGDNPDGWALLDELLQIQFRRGNRTNSELVSDASYAIENSETFGDNGALVITLDEPEVPEGYLYYDILQANGIRFGYGSVEVIRGVSE